MFHHYIITTLIYFSNNNRGTSLVLLVSFGFYWPRICGAGATYICIYCKYDWVGNGSLEPGVPGRQGLLTIDVTPETIVYNMMFLGQGCFFVRTYYFVFVLPNCLIYFHVLALICVCFVWVWPACTFIWTWHIWNLPFGLPLLLNGLYLLSFFLSFFLSFSLSLSCHLS